MGQVRIWKISDYQSKSGRDWEHGRIESQKNRLQCLIHKMKVVKFILKSMVSSPGGWSLPRQTGYRWHGPLPCMSFDCQCFLLSIVFAHHTWILTIFPGINTGNSSRMIWMMWHWCRYPGTHRFAMSTVSTLSRQGSPRELTMTLE